MKQDTIKKVLHLEEAGARIVEVAKQETKRSQTENSSLFEAVEIGFSIALPIVSGALFGLWLDRKFGLHPKLTLVFLGVGILGAFASLFKLVNDFSRKK